MSTGDLTKRIRKKVVGEFIEQIENRNEYFLKIFGSKSVLWSLLHLNYSVLCIYLVLYVCGIEMNVNCEF